MAEATSVVPIARSNQIAVVVLVSVRDIAAPIAVQTVRHAAGISENTMATACRGIDWGTQKRTRAGSPALTA
jgi:hypothetical protein